MRSARAVGDSRGALRANGLALVVLLVAAGMGAGSVLYRWKAPAEIARLRAEKDALPAAGPERLERWTEFGQALVHQRLVSLRLSAAQPWIVTHTVGAARNAPDQEVWGVDLAQVRPDATRRDGMQIVVSLPAAKLLGHGPIGGDKAMNVPHLATSAQAGDADARARSIVESALDPLAKGLEGDVEGARLVVRVGKAGGG